MNEPTEVVRPGRWHVVDGVVNWLEGHARELCAVCGVHPIPATATAFSCEHGSWALTDPEPAPVIVAPTPPAPPTAPHTGDATVPGDETGDQKVDDADAAVLPADAPAKRAGKPEWEAYAIGKGMDVTGLTKEDIIRHVAELNRVSSVTAQTV